MLSKALTALRLRRGVALALVAPVVSLLPTPTAHAASTCHGQPATIEASAGVVTGTPGDDVIVVTGTVTRVDAGDGDDLVCLVDTRKLGDAQKWLFVDPGAGDDVVDASEAGAETSTSLGAGADSFTGGAYRDGVSVGTFPPLGTTTGDPGPDLVRTGAGRDGLSVRAGAIVDAHLGKGADSLDFSGDGYVSHAYAGPNSQFDLGVGRDIAQFRDWWETPGAYETSLLVDLTRHRLSWHGVTSTLRGAEDIQGAARRIDLRGNGRPNDFYVHGCDVVLKGRAGDDSLSMPAGRGSVPETAPSCTLGAAGHRAYGNSGDDYLEGGPGHDVLIGGPGFDKANGNRAGRDRCEAERTWGKGCQR